MTNNQYINAYRKTQQSSNAVTTSYQIVRTLMKELVNSMHKIVLDIQDERKRKSDTFLVDKAFEEKNARNKSKNLSKSLSIIYGLQTSLDFDKASEIALNLFEYIKSEIFFDRSSSSCKSELSVSIFTSLKTVFLPIPPLFV
jgi:flagellar protein FliS